MKNCVEVPLKNSIGKYKSIRISLEYCKGRMVGISDVVKGRGIYVFIRPIKKTKYPIDYALFGTKKEMGLSIFLKKLNRRNTKLISELFDKINHENILKQIIDLYENENYDKIEKLVLSVTECEHVVENIRNDFSIEF